MMNWWSVKVNIRLRYWTDALAARTLGLRDQRGRMCGAGRTASSGARRRRQLPMSHEMRAMAEQRVYSTGGSEFNAEYDPAGNYLTLELGGHRLFVGEGRDRYTVEASLSSLSPNARTRPDLTRTVQIGCTRILQEQARERFKGGGIKKFYDDLPDKKD